MTQSPLPTRVAFLGLGAMGIEMATNLARAGVPLTVWNRSPAKARAFANSSAGPHVTAVERIADALEGAGVVVAIVSDDEADREVMLGAEGVLASAAPGTIIIDSSTHTPALAREIDRAATARGLHYLDAPVSGSTPQARKAELVFIVGGASAALDAARPTLAHMGTKMLHVGAAGAGATMKLINNMISGTMAAALAETVAVAEAAGLAPEAVLELLSDGATGSRMTRSKIPKMTSRDFSPQFQVSLMEKDLRYFLTLAEQVDRPAPIAGLVRSQYQVARRADLGGLDTAALILLSTGERKPG